MERRDFNKFLLGVPFLPWGMRSEQRPLRFHAEYLYLQCGMCMEIPVVYHKFRLVPETAPVITNAIALVSSVSTTIPVKTQVCTTKGILVEFDGGTTLLSSAYFTRQLRGRGMAMCLSEFEIAEFGKNIPEGIFKSGEFHKAFA